MKNTTLVSLGMSCQSAHQMARFVKCNSTTATFRKSPFDWLICPINSASQWLNVGLPDFNPTELSITRDHTYWEKYNFWFWHGFYTKIGGQRHIEIVKNSPRELEKLAYQRTQFQNLDLNNTVFIVSNTQNNLVGDVFSKEENELYHFTAENIAMLQATLNDYFNVPANLQIFTRPDRADKHLLSQPNTHVLSAEPSEWKGSNTHWDKALSSVL